MCTYTNMHCTKLDPELARLPKDIFKQYFKNTLKTLQSKRARKIKDKTMGDYLMYILTKLVHKINPSVDNN